MNKLKLIDIAKALKISNGRVTQLKAKGMPVNSIDLAAAWYRENINQKLSPKLAGSTAPPPAGETMAAIIASAFDINVERAKREHHEANIAHMRERQMAGELVDAARVRLTVTTCAAMTRSALERIPDMLSDRLAAEMDASVIHAMMTAEIDLVLAAMASDIRNLKFTRDTHENQISH